MADYYDVTLAVNIPHGTDILKKSCTVVFTYPNGSQSNPYSATVFAWLQPNVVRIASKIVNIDAGWKGANGGTLAINMGIAPVVVSYPIAGFVKVPNQDKTPKKIKK